MSMVRDVDDGLDLASDSLHSPHGQDEVGVLLLDEGGHSRHRLGKVGRCRLLQSWRNFISIVRGRGVELVEAALERLLTSRYGGCCSWCGATGS